MRLVDATERQRGFGDYAGYGLVAEGKAEIYAELDLKPWDLAPCKLLVEEAGRPFTDWEGKSDDLLGHGAGDERPPPRRRASRCSAADLVIHPARWATSSWRSRRSARRGGAGRRRAGSRYAAEDRPSPDALGVVDRSIDFDALGLAALFEEPDHRGDQAVWPEPCAADFRGARHLVSWFGARIHTSPGGSRPSYPERWSPRRSAPTVRRCGATC